MMRDDKLIELFRRYVGVSPPVKLADVDYARRIAIETDPYYFQTRATMHATWMATVAIEFIHNAQMFESISEQSDFERRKARSAREKAHRWLGFIQGVLWMAGVFTLDELKEHSHKCSDDYKELE
jgi:hypothetical protein